MIRWRRRFVIGFAAHKDVDDIATHLSRDCWIPAAFRYANEAMFLFNNCFHDEFDAIRRDLSKLGVFM